MSTASENVKTMLLPTATFVAAYVGEELLNVGTPTSAVVKPRLDVSLMPSNELPEESSKEVLSIFT